MSDAFVDGSWLHQSVPHPNVGGTRRGTDWLGLAQAAYAKSSKKKLQSPTTITFFGARSGLFHFMPFAALIFTLSFCGLANAAEFPQPPSIKAPASTSNTLTYQDLVEVVDLGFPTDADERGIAISPDRRFIAIESRRAHLARDALKELGKPVELYIFPNEYHNKTQPMHRWNVYRRNVQWFQFWLQGFESDVLVST